MPFHQSRSSPQNTYSMQDILSQPIAPDICKKVLQQIKSPLMQQSFILTNDESIDSSSFINPPKRPDIPPAPLGYVSGTTKRPCFKSEREINNNKSKTYGYGGSFFDQRPQKSQENSFVVNKSLTSQDYYNSNKNRNHIGSNYIVGAKNGIESRIQIESIVSPLDPNITVLNSKRANGTAYEDGVESDLQFLLNPGLLCGKLMKIVDHEKANEAEYQVNQLPPPFSSERQQNLSNRSKVGLNHIRKKIFQNGKQKNGKLKACSILLQPSEMQNKINGHIQIHPTIKKYHSDQGVIPCQTLNQAVKRLQQHNHTQLAQFIDLTTNSIQKLKITIKQRQFLQSNILAVYSLIDQQNSSFEGVTQNLDNHQKILSRFNLQSLPQLIGKLSSTGGNEKSQGASRVSRSSRVNAGLSQEMKEKNQAIKSIQTVVGNLAQIEKLTEQFINKNGEDQAVKILKRIYRKLIEKFAENDRNTSLALLIQRFYQDIGFNKYDKQILALEYFWPQFNKSLLPEEQFIQGILKNHIIFRDNTKKCESRNAFQENLQAMGFVKNT